MKKSSVKDSEIEDFLRNKQLKLVSATNSNGAYASADFVIVATLTDYDPKRNYFDASTVENVISQTLAVNPNTVMVIKSTVPVRFTEGLSSAVLFSTEFLCGYDL